MRPLSVLAASLVALALAGCPRRAPEPPPPPRLTLPEVVDLIPSRVKERTGWAEDVLHAFEAHALYPDLQNVCAVLAVIEQESGYEENPAVKGLSKLVRKELEEKLELLGPMKGSVLEGLLAGKAPETKLTFHERLDRVRTERDLDLLFRDLLDYYRVEMPKAYQAANMASQLSGRGAIDDWNPITTAGSMQVQVAYALEVAGKKKREAWQVRDSLYTRRGGVDYGTSRLLGYSAGYDRPVYRFADYNAGFYASRNAALQRQLTELTGIALATDGDLLAYDEDGDPSSKDSNTLKALLTFREKFAPGLSEWTLRRDVRREKEQSFEETKTWEELRRVYRERTGKDPHYAELPDVAIESPKMAQKRSTAWFARSVNRRYEDCLSRPANTKRAK